MCTRVHVVCWPAWGDQNGALFTEFSFSSLSKPYFNFFYIHIGTQIFVFVVKHGIKLYLLLEKAYLLFKAIIKLFLFLLAWPWYICFKSNLNFHLFNYKKLWIVQTKQYTSSPSSIHDLIDKIICFQISFLSFLRLFLF